MSYIQPQDRHQFTMMGSLDDLVPFDHPVRLLDQMIDQIITHNPDQFGVERRGEVGRPEYSPSTMLKELFYGYCNGIRASRKLEIESGRNIELMWLLGCLMPDHWVIANYRKVHGDQIKFVATQLRRFLYDNEYISGKRMAVDGSKFKANARRNMLTAEDIAKRFGNIEQDLAQYLQDLTDNDAREDHAEDSLSDGSPRERETVLIDNIVKHQQELERLNNLSATMKETGQERISPTDPEARMMRSRYGKVPAYNVQIMVDDKHRLIADSEVLTDENDQAALPVMAGSLIEELGRAPDEMLGDTGYFTPDDIQKVETDHGITCYIYPQRSSQKDASITFVYDQQNDQYWCSQGKPLPLKIANKPKRRTLVNVYQGTQCLGCLLMATCTKSKVGRIIQRHHNHEWRERFKERMNEYKSRIILATRKGLVEHPFGTLKWLAGKIPLLLRGRSNVATEINLLTSSYNLKRLVNLESFEILTEQFASYTWGATAR